MLGVISNYRELKGFQPLELTDVTLLQQVYCPITPRATGSLSTVNSLLTPSKRSLRKLNN